MIMVDLINMIPRETDFTKQESSTSDHYANNVFKPSSSTSTSSSWSRLKSDPRVVRVSNAFGGKDRHSKVRTARGLRDRRVRLSVPTAIQLYDLQDRLGLSQPSKVVDWLLNVAKNEIDGLPPLQIPPGSSFQPVTASQLEKQGVKLSGGTVNWNDPLKHPRPGLFGGKSDPEVSGETGADRDETNWGRSEEAERQFNMENAYVSANNLLNTSVPYNSFVRWDPSNLTLSHPTRSHGVLAVQPPEDWHNLCLASMPVPSGPIHHQFLMHQPGMGTQCYFPPQVPATNTEYDTKQLSFQGSQLSTSSLARPDDPDPTAPPVRPIHFSMTANLLPDVNEQSKGDI